VTALQQFVGTGTSRQCAATQGRKIVRDHRPSAELFWLEFTCWTLCVMLLSYPAAEAAGRDEMAKVIMHAIISVVPTASH
jgi:hypothetical protein